MFQFCPLCRKTGSEKRIQAMQINYEEAVWMCESETCPWPFGYEELKFIPQTANFLDVNNTKTDVHKSKELLSELPMPTDLYMYTPPVTPIGKWTSTDATKNSKGDSYASMTANLGSSDISKCTLIPNNHIKKENEKDYILKKYNTLSVTPSIFDIDSQTPTMKKWHNTQVQENKNTLCEMKDHNEIKSETTMNYTKSKNLSQNRPHIRSIEVIEVKSENDPNIDSDKYSMKSSMKIISKKKSKERMPLKNTNGSTYKSVVENNLNSQNSSERLFKNHNYSQINSDKLTKNFHGSDQREKEMNNLYKTSENMSDNEQYKSMVQNAECFKDNDQPIKSSTSPVALENLNLNNFLDDMLLNDLSSTQNIDDDWLKSFFV